MGWLQRAVYFKAVQIRVSFQEVLVSIQETAIVAPASYSYFASIHRFGDPAVIRWADWLRREF
jgi:hypothetical protein